MTLSRRDRTNLEADLARIYGHTTVQGRRIQNIVLAQQRARAWADTIPPGTTGTERGGSSSHTETAERAEHRRVATQAAADIAALPTLIAAFHRELVIAWHHGQPTRALARAAEALAQVVTRYVRTIDHSQLPHDTSPPGCVSCDRLNRWRRWKGGPVWEPIHPRYQARSLCHWCGTHDPTIEDVAYRHTYGEARAGRRIAKRLREAEDRATRICRQPIVVNGVHGICGREFMHTGRCALAEEIPA